MVATQTAACLVCQSLQQGCSTYSRRTRVINSLVPLCACSIVVLAGDTLPIDVYCHLPIMCEDRSLPYAYIPSKVVSPSISLLHVCCVDCILVDGVGPC